MKTWQKVTLGFAATVVLAIGALGFGLYRHVTQTIPDCYAQWGTAELLIAFHQDKGKMPATWSDLMPYFSHARHGVGLSFTDIETRIRIDFSSLHKLEAAYTDTETIPEVITTASGSHAHWEGAEPNRLVNSELQKPKLPTPLPETQ